MHAGRLTWSEARPCDGGFAFWSLDLSNAEPSGGHCHANLCRTTGVADAPATTLAAVTIEHFTTQLEAVDKAIRETIDQDVELRGKRSLLLSVIASARLWPHCW
jgi:hypothetical protein